MGIGVEVADEQVERPQPLDQAVGDLLPLAQVDDPGDDVERPRPVDVALLGVDRERDAHRGDGELGGLLALGQLGAQLVEVAHDTRAARSGRVGAEHLVPPGRVVTQPGRAGRVEGRG
jgi:hypothetical protein